MSEARVATIDVQPRSAKLERKQDGLEGTFTLSLSNARSRSWPAKIEVEPEGETQQEWIVLPEKRQFFEFGGDKIEPIPLEIKVPAGTKPGTYHFTIRVMDRSNPDEDYDKLGASFEVAPSEQPTPERKGMPAWLIVLIVMGVVLLLSGGGLGIYLAARGPGLGDDCNPEKQNCRKGATCDPRRSVCLATVGQRCKDATECQTESCEDNQCQPLGPGDACEPELSLCAEGLDCSAETRRCSGKEPKIGAPCEIEDPSCPEGAVCDPKRSVCLISAGNGCADAAECQTGRCAEGTCQALGKGDACDPEQPFCALEYYCAPDTQRCSEMSGPLGKLGQPCAPNGAYACAGHAQRGQLVCADGKWATNGTCPATNNCDTSSGNVGFCTPIIAECAGKELDDVVCRGTSLERCGPDLVTTTLVQTCEGKACWNGACTGECEPGETQCSGQRLQTCSPKGAWSTATCKGGVCKDGACTQQCVPPDKRCSGSEAQVCTTDGRWDTAESCVFRSCQNGTCTGGKLWQATPIGFSIAAGKIPPIVVAKGSAFESNGTFTVTGSGHDIWGTFDAFQFLYTPPSTDAFEITARVPSLDRTNPWAKAGVMIRQSLNPNSPHAMMAVTPDHGFNFQFRQTSGGSSSNKGGPKTGSASWVRLSRGGNTFTGYSSLDGKNWTKVGTVTIKMGSAYAGLAVTSHAVGKPCKALFDQVTVRKIPFAVIAERPAQLKVAPLLRK